MTMYQRAVDKHNTEAYAAIGKLYEQGQGTYGGLNHFSVIE
jgi:hypothetical protein